MTFLPLVNVVSHLLTVVNYLKMKCINLSMSDITLKSEIKKNKNTKTVRPILWIWAFRIKFNTYKKYDILGPIS